MSVTAASEFYERTTYEAILDIKYGIVFNRLNQRLYDRLDGLLGFVGLAGGSSAIAAGYAGNTSATLWIGAVLAAASIVERLIGAARKSEAHRQAQEAYADLLAKAAGLDLVSIERELTILQAKFPDGFSSLGAVAFNRNLVSNGRGSHAIKVPFMGRLLGLLA